MAKGRVRGLSSVPKKLVGANIRRRRELLRNQSDDQFAWSRRAVAARMGGGLSLQWLKRVEGGQELPAHLLPILNQVLMIPPNDPYWLLREHPEREECRY